MNCVIVCSASRSRLWISVLLAIRYSEPEQFRRVPMQNAPVLKIRILGYDRESVLFGVLPYAGVVCSPQTDSHQRGASPVGYFGLALAVGGIGEASAYVFFHQVREFLQNFGVTHSAGQILQNVINSDSQPANAGLSATLAWLNRNDIGVAHTSNSIAKNWWWAIGIAIRPDKYFSRAKSFTHYTADLISPAFAARAMNSAAR